MNKRLLAIYVTVFLLIGLMLYLYRSSYNDMKIYIRDVNTVSSIMIKLEKLDALIHFWLNNDRAKEDNLDLFIPANVAYDSILTTIEQIKAIALYQEERLRMDSIKRTVKRYQSLDENTAITFTPEQRESFRKHLDQLSKNSFAFSSAKLGHRKEMLEKSSGLLDKWLVWMLILAGSLITIATFYSFSFLEQRRRAEGFNHTLLQTTTNGIVSLVPVKEEYIITDYRINYCNDAALKLLKLKEWKGKRLRNIVTKPVYDDIRRAIDEVVGSGKTRTIEGYMEHGHERNWLQATIALLDEGVLVSVYNLNPVKTYEQRLTYKIKQLEVANDELKQYAYITSHDLQEPLRKIQMFTDMAMRLPEAEKSKTNEYFNKILATASHMRELIQTLLMFTRSTDKPEEFKPVNLNQLFKDVLHDLEIMISEKKAKITRNKLPTVQGSDVHLKLLFSNLIQNALKYAKPGGIPAVSVTCEKVTPIELRKFPALDQYIPYIKIIIKDNGLGFNPQLNEKIFTLFQRAHNKEEIPGTGIGLAICRKIVHQHHGYLYAEGEEGVGASFFVFLPVEQPAE